MCQPIAFNTIYRQSYANSMTEVRRLTGVTDLWAVDLSTVPSLRAKALAGNLGRLTAYLDSALHFASKLEWRAAVSLLQAKQGEVARLEREARQHGETVDVIVLDSDWGRKGRGAKIVAWIIATNADAADVARRFQLAVSTAKDYCRRARKSGKAQARMAA